MRSIWLKVLLGALVVAGVLAATAGGSHFRYGNYTWVSTGPLSVEFTLANGFRRSGYTGTGGDGRPIPGDVITESIGGTTFNPGDNIIIGNPLRYLVTSVDVANDWLFGLALDPADLPAQDTTIDKTYATAGDKIAFTASAARIAAAINASNASYRVETIVNVGGTNHPPVSAMPPIVNCPTSGLCSFQVPANDADGDTLSYRFSSLAESGIPNQPGPPHATNAAAISNVGLYTWDTTGATLAGSGPTYYATQVTIEDRDGAGAVKSKIAVDFLIQLVTQIGTVPTFVSPTPTCSSTLNGTAGSPLTFTVNASDADSGDTVTLTVAGLPVGATLNPALPASGNPVQSAFSWTPSAAGTTVVTFVATDSAGNQALCAFTLAVSSTKSTSTTYTGGSSVQYSDGVTLSGTLLDTSGAPIGIAGKQLDFTLGTQNASASPTDASGNASTSLVVTQTPGSVTTVQTAFAGDLTYSASNDSDPFAINKEDCTVAYTGDTLVNAAAMTNLSAQFGELDASPGDWLGKTITFTVTDAALIVQTFTALTDSSGVASTTAALGPNVYGVAVSFAGDDFYLACASATDTLVTVQSAAAKITGGGWISVGTGRTNFGFNVIRDVTGLKGQLQVRVRSGKDRFHSTSVLTLNPITSNSGTWTGTGRWNGVTGYTFTVSVVDNGTSGKKGDTISIEIKSPTNVTVFTTNGPSPLKGGNIVVH